jgi:hypothetical protein
MKFCRKDGTLSRVTINRSVSATNFDSTKNNNYKQTLKQH